MLMLQLLQIVLFQGSHLLSYVYGMFVQSVMCIVEISDKCE
jgi:hypothetical protein